MRTTRRIVTVILVASGALTLAAGSAVAHVEPDPASVKPGTTATVAFNLEHGCDGSPTTSMTFRIPKGATDVAAVAKDGWTTRVTPRTVVFEGGSQPGDKPTDYSITFTAPSQKTSLTWKVIQRCEQGVTRWIEKSEQDDYPAPVVLVGKKASSDHGG